MVAARGLILPYETSEFIGGNLSSSTCNFHLDICRGGGICPLHNMFGGGGGGVGGRGDANVLTCQFSWGRWGEGANVRGADVLHPIG